MGTIYYLCAYLRRSSNEQTSSRTSELFHLISLIPQSHHGYYHEYSRVKEIYFSLSPSHQTWQYPTACMRILLHLRRGAGKVVIIQGVRDVGQVTTTEIVCEANQGVELVLVDLYLRLVNRSRGNGYIETCASGTYRNSHVFVDACLERICITVQ